MDSQKKKICIFTSLCKDLMYVLTVYCDEQCLSNDFAVGYWVVFKLAQTHQWTLLSVKHNISGIHVNHNNATAPFQQYYYKMIILFRNMNLK